MPDKTPLKIRFQQWQTKHEAHSVQRFFYSVRSKIESDKAHYFEQLRTRLSEVLRRVREAQDSLSQDSIQDQNVIPINVLDRLDEGIEDLMKSIRSKIDYVYEGEKIALLRKKISSIKKRLEAILRIIKQPTSTDEDLVAIKAFCNHELLNYLYNHAQSNNSGEFIAQIPEAEFLNIKPLYLSNKFISSNKIPIYDYVGNISNADKSLVWTDVVYVVNDNDDLIIFNIRRDHENLSLKVVGYKHDSIGFHQSKIDQSYGFLPVSIRDKLTERQRLKFIKNAKKEMKGGVPRALGPGKILALPRSSSD